ncbi:MAG: hypothetical protein AAB303_06000 [Chloroflexota bacterium]
MRRLLDTDNGRASIGNILLNRKTLERLASIASGEAIVMTAPAGGAPAEEGQGESERGA